MPEKNHVMRKPDDNKSPHLYMRARGKDGQFLSSMPNWRSFFILPDAKFIYRTIGVAFR